MNKLLILLPLILLAIGACSQNANYLSTDQKLAKADELYARHKYSRAAELYSDVYFERSSAGSAHALLRQGDCYFEINKFTDARKAYQEFISVFPNNDQVSTAYFRNALCLYKESLPAQYDQTETEHSIDAFREFITRFPGDNRIQEAVSYIQKAQYKLIEKKYLTGFIYYKMKDYSSALMYFDEVTALGNTDHLDRKSLYYSAKLLRAQGLGEQAAAKFNQLKTKYPGSQETRKLAKLFK